MDAGTSPISSRKTVPVSACSNLPGLVLIAPVKAPFSNPNSSLSIRFSGRAVQLIFTNGASASGRIRGAPLDGICQNRYAALRSPTFGLLTIEHSIRMTTLVKIHRKGQMTLPTKLRSLAGISEGDLVEAAFQRGKIVITPKLVIDRSKFPNADDEYTPAQRRAVNRGIAQSEKEYKQGRSFGPFNTAEEMAASIEANIRKLRAAKKRAKPAQ